MATDFASNLKPQLVRRGKTRGPFAKLMVLLSNPVGGNARLLKRIERRVAYGLWAHGRVESPVGIDWGSIDWSAIIILVLKILLAILPLILMATPTPAAKRVKKVKSVLVPSTTRFVWKGNKTRPG